MSAASFRRRLPGCLVPVVAVAATAVAATTPASAAAGFVPVAGSGTSWSSIAIDQWAQAERPAGIVVSYNPDGSAVGRSDYIANQDDYAASDPPFRSGPDKLGGTGAEHPEGFSYIPAAAGGTALIYHLTVHGHLVTNLRLSPRTILGIFTGRIANWDDERITRDYGTQLPDLPITPVIHSDGDGGTYFLSRWLATEFPAEWNAFCEHVHPGITPPCGPTEFYPQFGNARAENGASNVLAYLASTAGNGAIGYGEYAYALAAHLPAVAVLNPAGKYVLPTAANVTAALTAAVIDEQASSRNFLQQNLDKVYTNTSPDSYPLSSYSYFIVPRSGTRQPANFTKAKGRTLSTFIDFALCGGQKQLDQIGYAPLPGFMVKGGLIQSGHIPGHVKVPPPADCHLSRVAPLRPGPSGPQGTPVGAVLGYPAVHQHAGQPGPGGRP